MRNGYRKMNMSKLSNRKHKVISTNEALKDVAPIEWSSNVLNGTNKVRIDKRGIKEVCVK